MNTRWNRAQDIALALAIAAMVALSPLLGGCVDVKKSQPAPSQIGGLQDADRAAHGLNQNHENIRLSTDRLDQLLK